MDWFEIISENFMVDGGAPLYHLERLREAYPVIPHGVSMSLGGVADPEHLDRLAALVERIRPPWASDHVCFTGVRGVNTHDLLPVPFTAEVRDHMVDRIRAVQDRLQIPFAIENASTYLAFSSSDLPEWEFLAEVAERADCAILLDVNNVFVSSVNHGFDPREYLAAIPGDRVVQIHLAGHSVVKTTDPPGEYCLDTHDHPIRDEVWQLYEEVIGRLGPVTTLIEWDDHIPSWERLSEEAASARAIRDRVTDARQGVDDPPRAIHPR
jgi:uncharacterized protein (UPF0276 family)